jgi:hypothetical protein
MNYAAHLPLRLLWAGAILLALTGQALFWLAVPVPTALLSPAASAEADSAARREARLSPEASADRRRLLQSSVDSVALSLGGIFQSVTDMDERRTALTTVLNSLTFELGGEVYFTAWDGTRVLHSPLAPDIRGADFESALDQRGKPFVRQMATLAAGGGGFLQVALPRPKNLCLLEQVPVPSLSLDADDDALPAPRFPDVAEGSPFPTPSAPAPQTTAPAPQATAPAPPTTAPAPPTTAPAPQTTAPASPTTAPAPQAAAPGGADAPPPPAVLESEPVEQLLYVRRIPHSPWYIAAFMPAGPQHARQDGFSPVFSDGRAQAAKARAEATLRRGLRIFGFALTGLACLLAYKLYRLGHVPR